VIARLSRLYPLHFLTLCIVAFLQIFYSHVSSGKSFVYSDNGFLDFIKHLFFASAWGIENSDGFNGPVWSVSVELLVYLVFFLNVRYLNFGKKITSLLLGLATFLALVFPNYVLFEAVIYFYAGFLVHQVLAEVNHKNSRLNQPVFSWLGLFVTSAATVALTSSELTLAKQLTESKYFFSVALLFFFVFIVAIVAPWKPQTATFGTWLEKLGNLTYSSYLLHFPIQLATVTVFAAAGQTVPWRSGWFFAAYFLLVLGLSHIVFIRFELPAKNYIRGVFSSKKCSSPLPD